MRLFAIGLMVLLLGAIAAPCPATAQVCGTLVTCPTASTPLSGAELLYMVQGGVSKKISTGEFAASLTGFPIVTGPALIGKLSAGQGPASGLTLSNAPLPTDFTGPIELSGNGSLSVGLPYNIDITAAPYNAKCDSATDDGPAISAAIQKLKTFGNAGGKIIGCAGKTALVLTSINATGLNPTGGPPMYIDFSGMALLCAVGSHACFDMTGSNTTRVYGLSIIGGGSGASESKIGLQVGVTANSGVSAGGHNFYDLTIGGFFTQSALYLVNSETDYFHGCDISNQDTSAVAAVVEDGLDHFNLASLYQTITRTPDTGASFEYNVFECNAVGGNSIPAYWVAGAYQHRFGSYANTVGTGDHLVTLYDNGTDPSRALVFDMHSEAGPNLQYEFLLTGTSAFTVDGLSYTDGITQAGSSIFKRDTGVSTVSLPNLNLNIQTSNGSGTPVVFDTPAAYTVSGHIYIPSAAYWSGAPASFAGILQEGTGNPQIWGPGFKTPVTYGGTGGYTEITYGPSQYMLNGGGTADPTWYFNSVGQYVINQGATTVLQLNTDAAIIPGSLAQTPAPVASVGCASGTLGYRRLASDLSGSATYGATATGGGSRVGSILCNGANWIEQ